MNQNRKSDKVFKLLLNLLLVIGLLFSSVHVAHAASWNIQSQGDCSGGYPKGASWLSWSGYSSSAWGKSWGYLYHWSGSSWDLKSSGYGEASGSSNSAVANDSAAYQGGAWQQTGAHRASFFSGQQNSYGNTFSC